MYIITCFCVFIMFHWFFFVSTPDTAKREALSDWFICKLDFFRRSFGEVFFFKVLNLFLRQLSANLSNEFSATTL